MVMGLASRFGGFYHDPNVDQEKILLERKQKIREKGNLQIISRIFGVLMPKLTNTIFVNTVSPISFP